jgi:CrcB protein
MDNSLTSIFYVALGGSIGSTLRYLATKYIDSALPISLSVGTLTVNIVGSFLAGSLLGAFGGSTTLIPPQIKLFLMAGVLGGFTTFSAFSLECITQSKTEGFGGVILFVGLHVVGSLVATALGVMLSSRYFQG